MKAALGGMDIGSMNAFQKHELSKATGMGVEQLMSLTQSKGAGVKGTLAEAAGLKTGADIAKGALKMDISLAGERLGMEQKQRKEMMKFEQRERMIMMQLEQAQKLKMLEVEAYFRVKYTKELEMSQEKQMAAAKHLEEMGSGIMMGGGKQLMDQAFAGLDKGGAGYSAASSNLSSIQGMIQGGQIDAGDMRLADYYNAQFELAEIYKKQPEELAKKLTETYDRIFAKEVEEEKDAQRREIAQKYSAFLKEKNTIQTTLEYLKYKEISEKRTLLKDEKDKMSALYEEMGKSMRDITTGDFLEGKMGMSSVADAMKGLNERLGIINGELNKDPNYGTGYYVQRPKGMIYPGEPGYGVSLNSGSPYSNSNGYGSYGIGGTYTPWMGLGGGSGGGGTPPPGPVVKVPNNYIVDTSSVVNAISSLMSANAVHAKGIHDGIQTVATGVLTGYDNMPSRIHEQITKLNTISTNGYTEMLRRTDVTNTLLDTLIGVTNEVSAKPINISGKRVNDVMTNVKNRVYGITGA